MLEDRIRCMVVDWGWVWIEYASLDSSVSPYWWRLAIQKGCWMIAACERSSLQIVFSDLPSTWEVV